MEKGDRVCTRQKEGGLRDGKKFGAVGHGVPGGRGSKETSPERAFPLKSSAPFCAIVTVLVTEPNSPSLPGVPILSSCSYTPSTGLPRC